MSKSIHTGRFIVPAGSTVDVAVSGLGFEPTSIAVCAGSVALATVKVFGTSQGAAQAVGEEGCISGLGSRYAPLPIAGVAVAQAANNVLFVLDDDTAAENVVGRLKSFDSDGFTIEVPANTTTADTIVLYSAYRSA